MNLTKEETKKILNALEYYENTYGVSYENLIDKLEQNLSDLHYQEQDDIFGK